MKNKATIVLLSLCVFIIHITAPFNKVWGQTIKNAPSPFAHPAWSEQSNVYEVNLRQFSASSSIKEFEKSLPRLKKMGVEILWFMPITPIGILGRKMTSTDMGSYYSVRDYKAVNPEFGTLSDWKHLVKAAHGLGLKVITDWVPNHTAPDNPWMKSHPAFYKTDSLGNTVYDADYTDTRNLSYESKELRDSMIAVMKWWVTETGIDGFRCDHVDPIPLDFWTACIDSLKKVKNVFMLAESENPALHTVGFDATYAWKEMWATVEVAKGKQQVNFLDSIINSRLAIFPASAYRLYFTTNHDENSWNGTEFEKYGAAYKAFAVFTQTMFQSVPLIYNGQEVPNKQRLKFFTHDPIKWEGFTMAPFYSTLLHLRRNNPALAADATYKKLATGNDMAIFAYVRQKAGHKIVVILNLSNEPQRFTIDDISIVGTPRNIFQGGNDHLTATHVFNMQPWDYIIYQYR